MTRHYSLPDQLFEAWLELPDGQHNTMDAEFRDIFEMSCEKSYRAILDEAEWNLEAKPRTYAEMAETLAALANHYERAMVTFLVLPEVPIARDSSAGARQLSPTMPWTSSRELRQACLKQSQKNRTRDQKGLLASVACRWRDLGNESCC
jgi:hypothetical protein